MRRIRLEKHLRVGFFPQEERPYHVGIKTNQEGKQYRTPQEVVEYIKNAVKEYPKVGRLGNKPEYGANISEADRALFELARLGRLGQGISHLEAKAKPSS